MVEFFTKVGSLLEFARFEMAPIAAEGDTVVAVGDQEYTITATGTVVTGRLAHVYAITPSSGTDDHTSDSSSLHRSL